MGSKWKSNRKRIPAAPNSGPERNARSYPITFKGYRQTLLPAPLPVLLGACKTITQESAMVSISRNSFQCSQEFQTEESGVPNEILPQNPCCNRRCLAGDQAGRSG